MTAVDLAAAAAHIAERPDVIGVAEDAGCDPEWLVDLFMGAVTPLIESESGARESAEREVKRLLGLVDLLEEFGSDLIGTGNPDAETIGSRLLVFGRVARTGDDS